MAVLHHEVPGKLPPHRDPMQCKYPCQCRALCSSTATRKQRCSVCFQLKAMGVQCLSSGSLEEESHLHVGTGWDRCITRRQRMEPHGNVAPNLCPQESLHPHCVIPAQLFMVEGQGAHTTTSPGQIHWSSWQRGILLHRNKHKWWTIHGLFTLKQITASKSKNNY